MQQVDESEDETAVPRPKQQVVVDHREPLDRLPGALEDLGLRVRVRRLVAGDLAVGSVLIERKEAHDFVQSLNSGRLFSQAYKLNSASRRPLVLVEGNPYEFVGAARHATVRGAFLALVTGFGIPLFRTDDLAGTARAIALIADQERRRAERRAKKAAVEAAVGAKPPPDAAHNAETLDVLLALPGVGPAAAHGLLCKFGSIDRLLAADPAELLEVPGIGGTTAARVLVALHRGGRSRPR